MHKVSFHIILLFLQISYGCIYLFSNTCWNLNVCAYTINVIGSRVKLTQIFPHLISGHIFLKVWKASKYPAHPRYIGDIVVSDI